MNTPKEIAEKLDRPHIASLDEILGMPFKVLDDGFIRVVDYMGSDESIVQAARVSYGKGTKKLSQDRELIRYLVRHQHTTPFEMCEIKFHVRVPMDTWRQWIRHRTASVNEYSTRYSLAIDAAQQTQPNEWRKQATSNRQGSEGFFDDENGKKLSESESDLHQLTRKIYDERIHLGVAREQARKDLTLSTYTEAYWKIDLHNLLHFIELRMDKSAQYEIRCYAEIMGNEIVKKWCPVAWEAFYDYRIRAKHFSPFEFSIVQEIIAGNFDAAIQRAIECKFLPENYSELKRHQEREELEAKLLSMNLPIPWKQ